MCWTTFCPPTTKTTLKQSTALCAPRHHFKLHCCADISCRCAISPPSGGLVLNATKMTLCCESQGWFRPEYLGPSPLKLRAHGAAATPRDPVCAGLCCEQNDSRVQQHRKSSSASFSNWGSGCSFTELQPVFLTLSTAQIIGVTFHSSLRREKTLGQKVLSSSPCLWPWAKRAIIFRGSEADTFSRLDKSNFPLLYHPADNETRWKKRPNVFPANSCC